jgi:hypothetical protein
VPPLVSALLCSTACAAIGVFNVFAQRLSTGEQRGCLPLTRNDATHLSLATLLLVDGSCEHRAKHASERRRWFWRAYRRTPVPPTTRATRTCGTFISHGAGVGKDAALARHYRLPFSVRRVRAACIALSSMHLAAPSSLPVFAR